MASLAERCKLSFTSVGIDNSGVSGTAGFKILKNQVADFYSCLTRDGDLVGGGGGVGSILKSLKLREQLSF